jgi:hypothetical protein
MMRERDNNNARMKVIDVGNERDVGNEDGNI